MAYGLLSTGFAPKTFDVIQDEITIELQAEYGLSFVSGFLATLRDIIAEREALLWEALEVVYQAWNPSSATGDALESVCELTGTLRLTATKSVVTLHLTGTAATVVGTGSLVATTSTAIQFETTANATLAAATAWALSTAYTTNTIRSNASRLYICIFAGTSAISGGPTTTAADITDGTARWMYIGEGTAYATATAQAVNTGPQSATAGDITTIVTSVGGWSSVFNLSNADLGTDIETDAALRIRRTLDLAASGVSTPDAIRQAVADITGVTYCHVFYNDTDTTDGDGIPPHAVEVVVRSDGTVNQTIFDTIREHVGAGIVTHGTTSGTSTDDEGVAQPFEFTEAAEVLMYVAIAYQYVAADAPLDYDAQVKTAIATWGETRRVGYNIAASAVSAQAFSVAGIEKVGTCNIGTAPAPGASTDITITARQIAVFDTARIATTPTAFTV